VLVTGFEPFGSYDVNPSAEVVRALERRPASGVQLETAVLPVVYGAAADALARAVAAADPDVVIALGQGEDSGSITVERVALAVSTAEEPDSSGRLGRDAARIAGAPDAYRSTLPVEAIVAALQRAGVPAAASDDAGGYVCNHVFFELMHLLATERPQTIGGFVHLPHLSGAEDQRGGTMEVDRLVAAVESIVATAAAEVPAARGQSR
jgi:pyroglutamyl-peptidase